jgi:hypothetical protein
LIFNKIFYYYSIIGLERVAEELMGRRKWKVYQDSQSHVNATDLLAKQTPSIGKS